MNSPEGPPRVGAWGPFQMSRYYQTQPDSPWGFRGSLNLGFKRQIQVETVFPELRAQRLHPKASSIPTLAHLGSAQQVCLHPPVAGAATSPSLTNPAASSPRPLAPLQTWGSLCLPGRATHLRLELE